MLVPSRANLTFTTTRTRAMSPLTPACDDAAPKLTKFLPAREGSCGNKRSTFPAKILSSCYQLLFPRRFTDIAHSTSGQDLFSPIRRTLVECLYDEFITGAVVFLFCLCEHAQPCLALNSCKHDIPQIPNFLALMRNICSLGPMLIGVFANTILYGVGNV